MLPSCARRTAAAKTADEMIGSKSPYYARQIQNAARRVPLSWLRKAASLCAETDAALKGGAADRQKQIELDAAHHGGRAEGGKEMTRIREAILVEGRYDVNTVRQVVDTVVLESGRIPHF